MLPVWILAAMAAGLGLGRAVPGLPGDLGAVLVGSVSLPIATGLLLMMYPVLAKIRYRQLDRVTGDRRMLVTSWVRNLLIGPAVMFRTVQYDQRGFGAAAPLEFGSELASRKAKPARRSAG